MTFSIRLAVSVMLVLTLGCAGSRMASRNANTINGNEGGLILLARSPNERVVEYDLNQDASPDVWNVYIKPEAAKDERLVRKEMDINWDKRIDIVRFYDDSEELQREAYDLDFDGRVDQVNYFTKMAVVRKERDLNYDGKTDLWIFYEKGQIARKERDSNHDGRVDYWEYWLGDQVDRIGEDIDGDGTVDRWTKNPQTSDS